MRSSRPLFPVAPGLSPNVWLLQAGVLLNFFGNGLVAPFLVIYLHYERGIPLALAGFAIASGGVLATTSGLVAGRLIDRFGARNCVALAMAANALAYGSYTQVHATWQAFLAGGAVGIGTGAYGPSVQSLLSTLVSADKRAAAFSQQRISAIVGLGLGGLVGGLIASGGRPRDYELLLLLDAGTFIAYSALVLGLPGPRVNRDASAGGYGAALRDKRLWTLAVVNLAMVSAGIAPMLVLLPALAKGQAHVSPLAIGVIFAVNTAVIVGAQLRITGAVGRYDPLKTLALGACLWVVSWALILVGVSLFKAWMAAAIIALAMVAYATGECIYTAILTPTVAAIAPEGLRGRYLAILGFAWQAGFMVGPAGGGVILGRFPLLLPVAAGSVCIVAIWILLNAERRFSLQLTTE